KPAPTQRQIAVGAGSPTIYEQNRQISKTRPHPTTNHHFKLRLMRVIGVVGAGLFRLFIIVVYCWRTRPYRSIENSN
ncbi:MAG: hypothetical protein EAZ78_15170, partial [Oscillatoriales cyanobacterium]|uniref:hypothetical protein n=1 Tax=Microcoleus anatoxicus TaxID=2705319 RepID=UPI00297203D8